MTFTRFSALPLVLFAAGIHAAPVTTAPTTTESVELDEFVISASRSEQPIAETLRPVSVITRTEIERAGDNDLLELLETTAGLQIGRNGNLGQTSSVFLRGADSNKVAVIIDGVRVNRSHSGGFAWEHYPLNMIERIEIVRGPHSSLYGADAIGGVIHITTRQDGSPYVSITAGTYEYGRMRVGGSVNGFYGHASLQHQTGPSATNSKLGNNFDNDSHRSNDIAVGYRNSFGEHEVGIHLERNKGDTEFDEGRAPFENRGFRASYRLPVWSESQLSLIAAHSSALNNSQGTGFDLDFKSFRNTFETALNAPIGDGSDVTLGLLFERDSAYTDDNVANLRQFDNDAATTAFFGQFNADYDDAQHELGFRIERHTAYGDNLTANYAFGLPLTDSFVVKAGFGTAFKTPTLNDLYHPGVEFFGSRFSQGNPDLQPERSRSGEFGVHYEGTATRASATAHYTHTNDLIETTSVVGGSQRNNISEAHAKGLEIDVRHKLGAVTLSGNVAWLAAVDDQGERLLRRADRTGAVAVQYAATNATSFGLEGRFSSDRQDRFFDSNTFTTRQTKLPGYSIFHAFADIGLNDDLSLNLRMENLLDKDYEQVYGYNTPGRSGFVTLTYQP